jgi:hypothetical protein
MYTGEYKPTKQKIWTLWYFNDFLGANFAKYLRRESAALWQLGRQKMSRGVWATLILRSGQPIISCV